MKLFEIIIDNTSFTRFLMKYNLTDDTMNELILKKVYNCPSFPRGSKISSDKRLISIDNGGMGGTHWICFYIKGNKSFYFDGFGGALDKFLLNQIPKPVIYRNFQIQDKYNGLCGSYCLYFFYVIERMDFYDAI